VPSSLIKSLFLSSLSKRVTSRARPRSFAPSLHESPERGFSPHGFLFPRRSSMREAVAPVSRRRTAPEPVRGSRGRNWNSRLTACAERSPSSPLRSISRSRPSRLTKFTRQGSNVSAVISYSSPEITALDPNTSPGSTNLRTRTFLPATWLKASLCRSTAQRRRAASGPQPRGSPRWDM
jgi:hypothetical protein